jgi:hypothetical protein
MDAKGGDSDDKIPEPKQDIADDLGVEAVRSTFTEDKISESIDLEVHAVIKEKEKGDKCEEHADRFEFLFKENPRYFAPGQKFKDAKCASLQETNQSTSLPTTKKFAMRFFAMVVS